MRLIFFGTGKFGVPTLKKLFSSGHEIAAVVSQPDKPKGRGWNVQPTAIKAVTEKLSPGLDILQPENTSDNDFMKYLKGKDPDLFVVIDYGKFLKKELLDIPRKYCINLHPSLLPKYRGAAPINWAILNGEQETGATVIKMNERMDAGNMITQEKLDIGGNDTAEDLSIKLSQLGADLVYWTKSALEVTRKVRGMQPWPGAFTVLEGKTLKIKKASIAEPEDKGYPPGTICDEKKFIITAGEGAIQVQELQLEGKKTMQVHEFLRGHSIKRGASLS